MTGRWHDVSARAGRNDLPVLLGTAVLVTEKLTDPDEIAKGVTEAWTHAE